jgi:uncharacterized protein
LQPPTPPPVEIRDPLHGAIAVDERELSVVDHPFVQRLRGIRQLGYSHLPFPGATHSRYSHSLGAMHLAGLAFDACFRGQQFSTPAVGEAYRHCVRLAALCHDLGHAPFSHAAEFAMPPLHRLGIDCYAPGAVGAARQASHEDYTIAILTRSRLAACIERSFPFSARHVAALVSSDVQLSDDFFVDHGCDHRGLLSQLVSSDLDVDRLDYLVRDSYYTGARYGQVDVHWLISNLSRHVDDQGRICLALDGRALYAFDDFMVARLHMFLMVYFHQKSIAYEHLLQRFMREPGCDYHLPADLDAYLECDDAHLQAHLRGSSSEWARRLVEQRPFKLALEVQGSPAEVDMEARAQRVRDAGIDVMTASSIGAVFGGRKPGKLPMYVLDRRPGSAPLALPVEEASRVFDRYEDARCIGRLYVAEEQVLAARAILTP